MSLFGKPSIPQLPPMQPAPPPIPDPLAPDAKDARARQQDLAKQRRGLSSTILTSPTGLMSNSATGLTLLGS